MARLSAAKLIDRIRNYGDVSAATPHRLLTRAARIRRVFRIRAATVRERGALRPNDALPNK